MSSEAVTRGGVEGVVPGRKAVTGVHVPPGGGGSRPRTKRREEPEFRSYYDRPVINKPVWESPDIPGYLFLGGLAGAGAAVGLGARITGRPALARASKVAAATAGHASLLALVHDLGRRGRFLNMLRVFKTTSPMSVGSWLLAGFVPSATVAALSDLTGVAPAIGALAGVAAAAMGLPVATYTAALISDTAVPAWHDGYEWMPFVFVSSAASAAAGLGLVAAPVSESGPMVSLGTCSGLAEIVLSKVMEKRTGMVEEAYHEGKAGNYLRWADILTALGAITTATSGRSRFRRAAGGAMLLAGSACTRFGIFEAGMASAMDPKYTVIPQRQKLDRVQKGGPV